MGSFYAYYVATISAKILGLDYFVKTLMMTIFGGLGVFPGSAIAAFIIIFGFEVMRFLGSYRIIILGALIIVIIIYMPDGIMGLKTYKINKYKLKILID
jgi:branched-chain amino acid transport system permease protein